MVSILLCMGLFLLFCFWSLRNPEIARHDRHVTRSAGTNPHLPRFLRMKICEENCNMFLLAVVPVFTVVIAAASSLVWPTDKAPVRFAPRPEQAPAADKPIAYVPDHPWVRACV